MKDLEPDDYKLLVLLSKEREERKHRFWWLRWWFLIGMVTAMTFGNC